MLLWVRHRFFPPGLSENIHGSQFSRFDAISLLFSVVVDPLTPANPLKPTVPLAVAQALQRAMSINIADRFETVEEFWQVVLVQNTQQRSHAISVELSQSSPPEQGIEDNGPESLQQEQSAPHANKRETFRMLASLLS